jgi:hypothetical protein
MFTRKQLEKLSEILWDYQDEGPAGAGWASKELAGLRDAVDQALRDREGFLPLPDRPISGWPLAFPFTEEKGLL